MQYRKIGETNLVASAITFGAWAAGGWMWGKTERNDAISAIRASYDEGVTSIDTAPIYGQGVSEEIVGEAIKSIPRYKLQIFTKFGMRWDLEKGEFHFHSKDIDGNALKVYKYAARESIIKECEDSLRRLKTDYIDLYQIHWPDGTTPIYETFEAVAKLIEQGKIRYAGVCNYNASQMAEAEKAISIASNQVPFSMLNRNIEKETVPYCISNKKAILAYSPMERGLLTGKITADYKFQEGDHRATHPFFQPEFIKRTNTMLQKIKPIANSKGIALSQLILRWTVSQPGITIALAGARNAEQAIQNAQAMKFEFNANEMEYINNMIKNF